jgi:adenine/guanine/hypoxanthine permease
MKLGETQMSKFFMLEALGTTYRREFIAGLTTFLSMAYILIVNPAILGSNGAGMDDGAVFTATALAAAIGCLIMGILAKYPIALAPGMGLNAFFAFSVVIGMQIPWETALAGVLVSGLIFIILTISGIREIVINAIPASLKYAVAAGIGLFISFIGLQSAGIIVDNPATLVGLGSLSNGATLLAIFGIIVTVVLLILGLKAGVFFGMVVTAVVGMIVGLIDVPTGVFSANIPSLAPTFGVAFMELDNIFTLQMFAVILTFLFVDFFDTAGTLVAVANQAGLMKDNKLPRASRALFSDSAATVVGATLGTSTTTSYIESSSGVSAGGRSGLSAVFVGFLFILALFFFPLLSVVTASVTAPALIVVGILMVSALGKIEWDKFEIAVPAFFTILAMPLTYSIATGIAIGFIFYPITMMMKGKYKEIHPIMYGMFVLFVIYFFLNH